MNAIRTTQAKTSLRVVQVLAELLERLENSGVPVGADQYRSVVLHLAGEFNQVQAGRGLGALLDAHPAAAQVYENMNYVYAGLCRSGLESSLAAEKQAKAAIHRAMRASREGFIDGQS